MQDRTHFHFALGYTGYFVLGYWLSRADIGKRMEAALLNRAPVLHKHIV